MKTIIKLPSFDKLNDLILLPNHIEEELKNEKNNNNNNNNELNNQIEEFIKQGLK